jgi:hypothetical protein
MSPDTRIGHRSRGTNVLSDVFSVVAFRQRDARGAGDEPLEERRSARSIRIPASIETTNYSPGDSPAHSNPAADVTAV